MKLLLKYEVLIGISPYRIKTERKDNDSIQKGKVMIQKILSLHIFILLTLFSFYSNAQSYKFLYYPLPTGDAGIFAQCYSICTGAPYCSDSANVESCVCTDVTGSSLCYTTGFTCGSSQTFKCSGGHVCQSGNCVCPSGKMDCGGVCVNYLTDPSNCGGCNYKCSGSYNCCSGARCIGTATDPNNCGQCGQKCTTCDNKAGTCSNGACSTPQWAFQVANYNSCGVAYGPVAALTAADAQGCAQRDGFTLAEPICLWEVVYPDAYGNYYNTYGHFINDYYVYASSQDNSTKCARASICPGCKWTAVAVGNCCRDTDYKGTIYCVPGPP